MISVELPSHLASLTGDKLTIKVEADSYRSVFDGIDDLMPLISSQIFNTRGDLRQFVAIFVNGEQSIVNRWSESPMREGDNVVIVFSIAGG